MDQFLKMFFICFVGISTHLHAYTDPGSGALIWQLLMAGLVGVVFYIRSIFSWISQKINRNSQSEKNQK